MLTMTELFDYLTEQKADFTIISHPKPIQSLQDAAEYFEPQKSVPTFILDDGVGLIALFSSSGRGRLDLKRIAEKLNISRLKMADRRKIFKLTGYEAGGIPLIGLSLPCIFDERLLTFDYLYGGSGDPLHTLKICPLDVKRLNHVRWVLDD